MTIIATLWDCPSETAVLLALDAFLDDFAASGFSRHVPPECIPEQVSSADQIEDWRARVRMAVERLDPKGLSDGDQLALDTLHHLGAVLDAASRRILSISPYRSPR